MAHWYSEKRIPSNSSNEEFRFEYPKFTFANILKIDLECCYKEANN
jgi:hypothetical protein